MKEQKNRAERAKHENMRGLTKEKVEKNKLEEKEEAEVALVTARLRANSFLIYFSGVIGCFCLWTISIFIP